MTSFERAPKPETLDEFSLYGELLGATGKALIGLEDTLIAVEGRERARAARRPSRKDIEQGRY